MDALITTGILGIFISVLGVMNMKGNISSIHWYHRQRVSKADRKPFGKLVGLGTLVIGVAMILFGILYFVYEKTASQPLIIIASVELLVDIVVGMGLSFYAMIKYNKGILLIGEGLGAV